MGRRGRILEFIKKFSQENRYPPSFREIRDAVGLASISSVEYHLDILEASGCLNRIGGLSRTIVLTPKGWAQ